MKNLDEIMQSIEWHGSPVESATMRNRVDRKAFEKQIRTDIQALIDASAVKWVPIDELPASTAFIRYSLCTVSNRAGVYTQALYAHNNFKTWKWEWQKEDSEDRVLAVAELPKPWRKA